MRVIIVVLFLFFLHGVYARDLGKYGNTYIITEPDLLEDIGNKLQHYQESGKLEKFNEKYSKEVKRQIRRPNRIAGITKATEDRRREFDPTTELEEDIFIPDDMGYELGSNKINADSKEREKTKYKLLYKAGTKINPLDYMVFNESLVFIDGDDGAQREFAHKYYDNNQLSKIILINGEVGFKKVGDREYYYYFDQWGAYSSRFNIVHVPSVVHQEEGKKVLTIDEVKVG